MVSAEERMQKGQSHLANLKAMMAAKRGNNQGRKKCVSIASGTYSLMHFQRPVDIALPLAFLINNLFTQRMLG